MHLTLSGGEPLAHPDFFTIGKRARELGFVTRIKSNGHALRGEILRRVKREVDPFLVEISLHGALAKTHDRQTRVSGSFDRLISNLAEMREAQLRVKLKCALTQWNEREIEGMFAIADKFEMPLVIDPEVTPRDNGDLEPLQLTASPEGLKHLVAVQSRRALSARAEIAREGESHARTQAGIVAPGRRASPWTPTETSIPASNGGVRLETFTGAASPISGMTTRDSMKSGI